MTELIDLEEIKREHKFACGVYVNQPPAPLMHRHRGQLIAEVERLQRELDEAYKKMREDSNE